MGHDAVVEVKRRGLGKKQALEMVSIRLDVDTIVFFKTNYPTRVQATMRAVLANYALTQGDLNESN